jgi:hypothetical protein
VLIVSAGSISRAVNINQGLWLDEAAVASGFLQDTLPQIIFYREWQPPSPPLLGLLARAATDIFGLSNFSLRLVPVLSSILALVLWVFLSRRLLSAPFAVISSALFALSPALVAWASAAKHYSSDLAAAVLLLGATVLYLESPSPRRFAVLLTVCVIALLLAFTAVMYLPAVFVAVWISQTKDNRARLLTIVTLTGAIAAANYLLLIAPVKDPNLQQFWHESFPASLSPLVSLRFFARGIASLACDFLLPAGLESVAGNSLLQLAILTPMAIGLFTSLRKPAILTATALPVLTAIGLAYIGRYPFSHRRTSLYLAPCFILLFARGLEAIWERLSKLFPVGWKEAPAWVPAISLGMAVLYFGITDFRKPPAPPKEDGYAAVQALRNSVSDGDLIYVHASARFQTRLYLKMIGWKPAHIVYGNTGWSCCSFGIDFQKANRDDSFFQQDFRRALTGCPGGKIWLIYSARPGAINFVGRNEADLHRDLLNAMACRQSDERAFEGLTLRSFQCPAH